MATAADYRKWAEECFEWARQASDEAVREQYASLGRVWLEQAARPETLRNHVVISTSSLAQSFLPHPSLARLRLKAGSRSLNRPKQHRADDDRVSDHPKQHYDRNLAATRAAS